MSVCLNPGYLDNGIPSTTMEPQKFRVKWVPKQLSFHAEGQADLGCRTATVDAVYLPRLIMRATGRVAGEVEPERYARSCRAVKS